jgi:hypothetical protein
MKKRFMLVLQMLRAISLNDLSEDLRKIAVSLITAGTIAIFIPSKMVSDAAISVGIIVGVFFWILGLVLKNADKKEEGKGNDKRSDQ